MTRTKLSVEERIERLAEVCREKYGYGGWSLQRDPTPIGATPRWGRIRLGFGTHYCFHAKTLDEVLSQAEKHLLKKKRVDTQCA
jgi:hypothetical protein